MTSNHRSDVRPATPTPCAGCGSLPASAIEVGDQVVWLCAACAEFEGLGCP